MCLVCLSSQQELTGSPCHHLGRTPVHPMPSLEVIGIRPIENATQPGDGQPPPLQTRPVNLGVVGDPCSNLSSSFISSIVPGPGRLSPSSTSLHHLASPPLCPPRYSFRASHCRASCPLVLVLFSSVILFVLFASVVHCRDPKANRVITPANTHFLVVVGTGLLPLVSFSHCRSPLQFVLLPESVVLLTKIRRFRQQTRTILARHILSFFDSFSLSSSYQAGTCHASS